MNHTHFTISLTPMICSTSALVGFDVFIRADLNGIVTRKEIEFQRAIMLGFKLNVDAEHIYNFRNFKGTTSLSVRPLNKNCAFYKEYALDKFIKNLKIVPLFASYTSRKSLEVIMDDEAHFLSVLKTLPFFFPESIRAKFFLSGKIIQWKQIATQFQYILRKQNE